MQQVRPRRVAVEARHPEAAHLVDMLGLVVEHHGVDPVRQQDAVHHLPETPEPGDDHRALLGDLVLLALLQLHRLSRRHPPLVEEKEQRRRQHRERHRQRQRGAEPGVDGAGALAEADQHEAEFAGLREAERKERAVGAAELEDPAERPEHRRLDRHQPQRHPEDLHRRGRERREVDPRPDRDEEEPEQQALERLDVALELLAEFARREHHAGEERPERRRQADEAHQQRIADHHRQRRRGEDLAEAGAGDEAEERPRGILAAEHHHRDRRQRRQRGNPPRQALDDVEHRHVVRGFRAAPRDRPRPGAGSAPGSG